MIKKFLITLIMILTNGPSKAQVQSTFAFSISFSLTKCVIVELAPPACSDAPGGLDKVRILLPLSQCFGLPNGSILCQGLSEHKLQMDGYTFFANILISEVIDPAGKISASGALSTGRLDSNGAHLNSRSVSLQFSRDYPSDEIGISSDWFYPSNPGKLAYASSLNFGPP